MMKENQLAGVLYADFTDMKDNYGYGVRTLVNQLQNGNLEEIGEFGWSGALGSYLLMDPKRKLTVVYAVQASPGPNGYLHERLRNVIYRSLDD